MKTNCRGELNAWGAVFAQNNALLIPPDEFRNGAQPGWYAVQYHHNGRGYFVTEVEKYIDGGFSCDVEEMDMVEVMGRFIAPPDVSSAGVFSAWLQAYKSGSMLGVDGVGVHWMQTVNQEWMGKFRMKIGEKFGSLVTDFSSPFREGWYLVFFNYVRDEPTKPEMSVLGQGIASVRFA